MLNISKHTSKRNKKSFNVHQKSLTLFMLRSSKIYLAVHENVGKHFVKFSEPIKKKLLSVLCQINVKIQQE